MYGSSRGSWGFGAVKDLPTAQKVQYEKGLCALECVVDQFVLHLEGLALMKALFPVADVVVLLQAPNMLHDDMYHQLVHGTETLELAELSLLDPLARCCREFLTCKNVNY